jgi:aminopeptidase N
VRLYSDFFGPTASKRVALTQQTACSYGQSWPGLVWLPMCYYYDANVRHELHLDFRDRGYWKVVVPHEVAHQWWGNQVYTHSYRDEWLNEGFADFSASLFIQMVRRSPQEYARFWEDEREMMLEKSEWGQRGADFPLTVGYRANSSRTGDWVTRRLIYPKGAWVLQMLRMMLWDPKTGDANFQGLMKDYASTFSGRQATTEDFKATVEKHMMPIMNLGGNGKMDWFFDEWVYGTAFPHYQIGSSFSDGPNGTTIMDLTIKQSGVDDKFKMLVPLYVEMANGNVVRLGLVTLAGNVNFNQKIPLPVKDHPKRALLNYMSDVLCTME